MECIVSGAAGTLCGVRHSLRSALLLRISEVIRHEKERGTASSLQAASAASVESYIRFLKSLLKG